MQHFSAGAGVKSKGWMIASKLILPGIEQLMVVTTITRRQKATPNGSV